MENPETVSMSDVEICFQSSPFSERLDSVFRTRLGLLKMKGSITRCAVRISQKAKKSTRIRTRPAFMKNFRR